MYARISQITAFGGTGFQGGASEITLVNDIGATDVPMKTVVIKVCKENSSVAVVAMMMTILKMIPKIKGKDGKPASAINSIQFMTFDTSKSGSPYAESLLYNHNKWAANGYLNDDGEMLKNAQIVEDFRVELAKHRVEMNDGTYSAMPIFIDRASDLEDKEKAIALKVRAKLKVIATKKAKEVRKASIRNRDGKGFDFNTEKVELA